MARLFLREGWFFPRAWLEARRCRASVGAEDAPPESTAFEEGDTPEAWVGMGASWGAALLGGIPFLLFGLAHLLNGIAELGGYGYPAFHLLGGSLLAGSLNRPALVLTTPLGVYFACALGLSFGVLKGFPRWSYAYLGMSLYFGWSYNQQLYYGVFYKWWVWLPTLAAILLGLLLARSPRSLAWLLQGAWNDWTRLSFALYAFGLPMLTVVFFDDDWGVSQLYGLIFDSVLLAAGAVAFTRARSTWGRVLPLLGALLILVLKGGLEGWMDGRFWLVVQFFGFYAGYLLLPALIGLLRWGVEAALAR